MLQRNARPRVRAGVALWLRTPGGRLWGARKSIPVTFIPLFERFLISCRRSRGGFGPRTSPCDRTGWRSSVAVHLLPAPAGGDRGGKCDAGTRRAPVQGGRVASATAESRSGRTPRSGGPGTEGTTWPGVLEVRTAAAGRADDRGRRRDPASRCDNCVRGIPAVFTSIVGRLQMKVATRRPIKVTALGAAAILAMSMSMSAFATDDLSNLHLAEKPVQGQYIVVLKEDTASLASETAAMGSAPQVAEVATAMARDRKLDVLHSYNNVLRGFVARADDRALARLLADPRVAFVEEDGVVSISAPQNNATWGLDRIDQRNRPLHGTYVYDTTAPSQHADVIDTGVRP